MSRKLLLHTIAFLLTEKAFSFEVDDFLRDFARQRSIMALCLLLKVVTSGQFGGLVLSSLQRLSLFLWNEATF